MVTMTDAQPDHGAPAILNATAATLRKIADGFEAWTPDDLYQVADEVAAGHITDWTSCPVCEEIECDEDCPLAPIRKL